ncbi:MAG: FxsA family protein [Parvularculales bacterium]
MRRFVLPLVIAFPFIEIALFIEVGSLIGVGATLFLVILSTMLGFSLLRYHGYITFAHLRAVQNTDESPATGFLKKALGTASAILLIIPGFLTDALGLLLLVPMLRETIARHILTSSIVQSRSPPGTQRPEKSGGFVIDAEDWHEISTPNSAQSRDDGNSQNGSSSPWQP